MNPSLNQKAANTIRILAAEAVQKANSGHPGMPMGMADCAFVLWNSFLNYHPEDPHWAGRDRFVLSAGHGSMLLYALLHLSGYDVSMEDLKQFRQWDSRTPGHPEIGCLPGVETTTGPLGQGFTNGVGMALAAKITAQKYNRGTHTLFGNHHIYGIVSDGDLMEGVASEAASLAGHLALNNLIYLYDDNQITIEGETGLAFSESVKDRFEAYGWRSWTVDGHNHSQIEEALLQAQRETEKPTLIIAKTHIGYGSPNKQDSSGVHGSPLGEEELALTKKQLGWSHEEPFYVPAEVQEVFDKRRRMLSGLYDQWQQQYTDWKSRYPELAEQYERTQQGILPENLEQQLLSVISSDPTATRSQSGKVIQKIAELLPGVYGGSADLAPSNNTYIKDSTSISAGNFSGRNFHFGIREHAMAGICNGLALYGGIIPFAGTFLVFSDYMRPSIRLAALMEQQVVYVFTHDSIFVGEDGPTHQPIEQITALRLIPNLNVFRPADGLETAMAWSFALRRTSGPTALCLTRQKLPAVEREADFDSKLVYRGGYVVSREQGEQADVVLVGTGSEVSVAVQAAELLREKDLQVRVVSMPSRELFHAQDEEYRQTVIPANARAVVVVEAGVPDGWSDLFRQPLLVIGMERFGASAPYQVLAEKFGFTGPAVAEKAEAFIKAKARGGA